VAADKDDVVNVVLPSESSVPLPMLTPPSRQVTVPVGIVTVGGIPNTAAWNVTARPNTDGLSEVDSDVDDSLSSMRSSKVSRYGRERTRPSGFLDSLNFRMIDRKYDFMIISHVIVLNRCWEQRTDRFVAFYAIRV
jgi:hypothetical protein